MTALRVQFPANTFEYRNSDNLQLLAGADGTAVIDTRSFNVSDLMRAGFTSVPYASGATGARPTVCPTGTMFFDVSLGASGKPVYRTGAGGWVDGTGAAA